jgi:predicted membrane protein
MKVIFQKMCTVAVILYLFFPFLAQTWKEIVSFYKEIIHNLSIVIAGNIFYSIALGVFAIVLILWILHDDSQEQEERKNEKEERKNGKEEMTIEQE